MNKKNFFLITVCQILFLLLISTMLILFVDPYFHYHKPLPFLKYTFPSSKQRYINDGITRNFEYDAIITGTSMTENFRTSQFDKIFNTNSIKIPFSGGSFKEINDAIGRALKRNKKIKYIFRGLDYINFLKEKDYMSYEGLPEYLYDEKIFNDCNYLINRKVLLKDVKSVIKNSLKNKKQINFDAYCSWRDSFTFKKEVVLEKYDRGPKEEEQYLTEVERRNVIENIEQNLLNYPKEYPNVKFIYFITPYSILYWDKFNQDGEINKRIEVEKIAIEKMLQYSNIYLYSFFDDYNLITDLNNYKDISHYSGEINDQILEWISQGKHRLTKENYMEYLNKNREFYVNYDYDSIFNKK